MATGTATKAGKKGTKSQSDTGSLVLAAALKRAHAIVEKQIGKEKLGEGGYTVDLSIRVVGDINVAAGSEEGEPKKVPAFNAEQLIAAMYAAADDGPALIDKALRKIALVVKGSEKVAAELQSKTKEALAISADLALRRGITEDKRSPAKAGAVTGKPQLIVTGTIGTNTVDITIDGE